MSRWTRISLIVSSFVLAFLSLLIVAMFIDANLLNGMITLFLRAINRNTVRNTILILFSFFFIASLSVLVYAFLSGRLRKARVRDGNLGSIDIGVDALESIALNAAKAAQSGVKTAKARILPAKNDKLNIHLNVMAYSDVELPAMMNKVQERVKKDIERYTGIEVEQVEVKVYSVDAIAARVDR